MRRDQYDDDHESFRQIVREFVEREVLPHQERWEREHDIDRATWLAAGKQGLLGLMVPPEYGGPGVEDYRFRCVIMEELGRVGAGSLTAGFSLQDDVAIPYLLDLGTDGQRQRWLPGMVSGQLIGAVAMTEPGAGSDLQGIRTTAVRDGREWVINGSKTFITNGGHADLVIVVCRTDPEAGSRGFSLFVVESGTDGFERGRRLEKLGLHAQDTAELYFDGVRVPAENLLGTEGAAFLHLMERLPRERLNIAMQGYAAARAAIDWTVQYTTGRTAFGKPIASYQNTQFELAAAVTEVDVLEAYVDKAVLALNDGSLTAVDAAKAKLWASEVQNRVIDRCLQLFGGYGYMYEYPICRAFADARVQTIYGGTSEVMKLIIGRDLTGIR
ncbi:acyl-CoA dehydrogenase family protein [Actinospica sp.]|uniref:acyl-CoA dehydrogenase family protein n=1 Tax=Actinospica sp. TaxID=1872142 RepID=UPI002CBDDDBD|nr:acyl-CoA dehydrogenase family protein [Actinospica sp.]HWG26716.1 acyl-CoA dehydrogenase family protein [Actinospica sp.]